MEGFTDWPPLKLLALSELLERHVLLYGDELIVAEKPLHAVYFIVEGEVTLTRPWAMADHAYQDQDGHDDAPSSLPREQATYRSLSSLSPYKRHPNSKMPIIIDRVTRHSVIGLECLLLQDESFVHGLTDATIAATTAAAAVTSKYSASVSSERIHCYALYRHQLQAFYALVSMNSIAQLKEWWRRLEQDRDTR